jgi:hypothetical protein
MQLPRRLDASDDGLYRASLLVFVALPPSQRAGTTSTQPQFVSCTSHHKPAAVCSPQVKCHKRFLYIPHILFSML